VLDPSGLYQLEPEQPEVAQLGNPVLLHSFTGFIDAGNAGQLAAGHLLAVLEHRLLARFDVDQLFDYRARRPPMTFVEDHWEDYDVPRLDLHLVRDETGMPFLMLIGAEPDTQWERFTAAVLELVRRYQVRLSVGFHAIPMAVPHTRPIGVTSHATRQDLVAGRRLWVGRVQVPGNITGLLELRSGQAGLDAAGFAVHVPHYLSQTSYPDAAATLLQEVSRLTGLVLPAQPLLTAGEQVRAVIATQLAEQPEVAAVVSALEEQYDAFVGAEGRSLLIGNDRPLPTGDELGAELERFLAEEHERRQRGDG
jgi:predicted ATP-grasp superfamily ATP-dependent carboligase